jgi:4-aminobutyrate aminotransferase-like enzyme
MAISTEPGLTGTAQAIIDQEREYLLQNYARYPLVLHRGKGAWLYDTTGKRYLDVLAGIPGPRRSSWELSDNCVGRSSRHS